MVKPESEYFVAWWELQEASGDRLDASGNGNTLDEIGNGVSRGSGHVGIYAADWDDNQGWLEAADAAWNTFGNESKTYFGWVNFRWMPVLQTFKATIIGKHNEPNDHEYALWLQQNRIYVAIARGGHVWEDTTYAGYGIMPEDTWFFFIYYYDADTNLLGQKWYDTSGDLYTQSSKANSTGFGTSADSLSFRLGRNEPGGSGNSNPYNGLMEQVGLYDGIFTADELLWMVNEGNGQTWKDISPEMLFSPQVIII